VPIRPVEVSTLANIPAYAPFGVFYYTQDTGFLYIGTGIPAGQGTNVTQIAGGAGGSSADTFLAASISQTLNLGTGNLLVDATAGAGGITLTLQSAAGISGQRVRITRIDTGAGTLTINTTSAQTINGSLTYVLTNQWQTVTLESNGTNWRVIATAG
jgi:hypothetical protein